jgi:hypothetical protein
MDQKNRPVMKKLLGLAAMVLLLVSAGGMIGGALGVVAVIPVVVSVRGAMRGWRE